jgi:hypothetical protein
MQQTRSYWRFLAVAGVVGALIASACTVTTGDDSSAGGAGGSSAAGSPAAGSPAAGSPAAGSPAAGSGTAGSSAAGSATGGASTGGSGPVSYQCDPAEGGAQGTPNSCVPIDANDVCQKCIQAKCCDQFEACYATDPGNQCGWGGPTMIDGQPNPGGEAYCILDCLQKAVAASGTAPEDSEVLTCGAQCATTKSNGASQECGPVPGLQTSDLVDCQRANCSPECFGA